MDDNHKEKFYSFEDMDLDDNILRGVYAYGFEKPSEIQARAIVPVAKGEEIIAQSQSGTGKTGTFVIGTLQRIDQTVNGCQAIIIAPTRELAIQIQDVCRNIGQYTKIQCVLCVGKSDINASKDELSQNAPIVVVGTPGRINDMIERNFLSTRMVQMLVLDEADEMLSEGFQDQIKRIVMAMPNRAQICLFSATIPFPVLELAESFMPKARRILIKREEMTLEGIRQFYIDVEKETWKLETFIDLFDMISVSQTMVYINSKKRAEWLKKQLESKNFTVSIIHGNMTPVERNNIMKEFRNGTTRILVSTDLLSRGIDIQQVSIVVNYDLPNHMDCYIHRIGRSGRFGRKGVAINFITKKDVRYLQDISKHFCTEIREMPSDIQEYLN